MTYLLRHPLNPFAKLRSEGHIKLLCKSFKGGHRLEGAEKLLNKVLELNQ